MAAGLAMPPGRGVAESPSGWEQPADNPAQYEVRLDSVEHYDGRRSASIACVPCSSPAPATLMQVVRADRYRGVRVRLAGYMKSAGVELWAGFWMRVDAAGRRSLAFDNMNPRAVRGTTAWTRYEVVLDVSEEAVQIAFGFLLAGQGQVWADRMSLTPVDPSVLSTDLGLSPEYAPVVVDSGVPTDPRNLSFEE
jgi:hypothetical protein